MQSTHWLRGAILAATASAVLGAEAVESTSARGNVLEEIVVTAQFVTQNLQDTPIAITAMSGETLEARGHQTVEQISAQAPNVTLTRGGQYAGPALIGFIRGVGQTDFNPALEPGVGLYVDDVYYSTLTGSVLAGSLPTISGKRRSKGVISPTSSTTPASPTRHRVWQVLPTLRPGSTVPTWSA